MPRTTGPGSGPGMGYGAGRARGGGRGHRNQYYATGLTGWQRAEMAPTGEAVSDTARLERIEAKLTETLDRLSRLEGAE